MKEKFGMKFGGLQQKILNLVLIFILLIIGLFVAISLYMAKDLAEIVESSSKEQKAAITQVSEETMTKTISVSMTQTTRMQAYMADNLFAEARGNVLSLQEYAAYIYSHRDEFPDKTVNPPNKLKNGIPSIQLEHEAGIDPADDPDLGLAANMGEMMLAMYSHSEVLNSCFIATVYGDIIYVDNRSGAYVHEDGTIDTFETRQRPWYKGAVETGKLYFTGIELDASTNIPGLVCAAPVYVNDKLVAVVGADIFLTQISDYVAQSTKNGGFICIINENGEIIFSPHTEGTFKVTTSDQAEDLRNSENKELAAFVTKALGDKTEMETVNVDGTDYYLCGAPIGAVGWTAVTAMEKSLADKPTETMLSDYEHITAASRTRFNNGTMKQQRTLLIWTLILLVLASASALAVAGRIVKPIERMTKRMEEINGSDLAFEMEESYKTNDEIEVLAQSFATLSKRTLEYITQITHITAEKERIGAELELATRIQADMLPNIFPAFPERPEFDIYASMTPAKEVGGDFYDFFLLDDNHLCMVIADVSGKGVPAALFMMMSKILVSNYALMDASPAKVLEMVNAQVCKNNEEEMFVTVWLGMLEISTGKVTAANAGHEYPILRKANGDFELLKDKHGFVVGGMDGVRYKEYSFTLEKGGTLFLYTDGVAEATNGSNELFGTDRMLEALNQQPDASPKILLKNMKQAVDTFVGDAPQFDDLTMLGVKLL